MSSSGGPDLRVTAKKPVAEGVVEIVLEHRAGRRLWDWTPGAHIDLVLPDAGVRQYSLCGDRWDAYRYRIAVLREPDGDGGSTYVHDRLRVGDLVEVGGPRNRFPMVPARRYVFIAGGIGITPFLPMIRQADLVDVKWTLVYGGRRRATMAYLDELEHHGDNVRVMPEDECGRLSPQTWLGTPEESVRVYCCGPEGLIRSVERACRDWPAPTLRVERFAAATGTRGRARNEPFEVVFSRSGGGAIVPPGKSVLEVLRESGHDRLSSCSSGVCGTCATPVVEGRIDHRDSLLSDDERAAGDRMLPCVSRSFGNRLVLDL